MSINAGTIDNSILKTMISNKVVDLFYDFEDYSENNSTRAI